jgi:hypothetical protein
VPWWLWAVPIVLFLGLRREAAHEKLVLEAVLALGLLVAVGRRPYGALMFLVTALPFNAVILSALYRYHVPGAAVRGLGFWKEGVVAGVVVAAVFEYRRSRPRLDLLDRAGIGYIALGSAYLVAQHLFVGNGAGGHLTLYARELGWRGDVLYVGVLLAVRHLHLPTDQVEKLLRRCLTVVFWVAVIGVYEFFRPYSFNHFLTVTLQLGRYQAQVLHSPLPNPNNVLAFANGTSYVRIGSVLINNLLDGWYYVLGLSIAVEGLVRGRRTRFGWVCVPVIGAALVFTQARGSIIAGGVAVLLILRRQVGRSLLRRVHLGTLLTMGLLVAVPVVVISGLGHRFTSSSSSVSNQGHVAQIQKGVRIMEANPLGNGLATGVAGGQSAAGKGLIGAFAVFDPEDQYLEIGMQLGFLGLALWAVTLAAMLARMKPRAPDVLGRLAASGPGVRAAFIGMLVGATVAQVFTEPVVSWTVFALCGAVVGNLDPPAADGYTSPPDSLEHGTSPTLAAGLAA